MMKLALYFIAICTTSFSIISCSQSTKPNIKLLGATEFKSAIDKTTDNIILDVRTPEEYAAGHISNAVNLNILDENFKNEIQNLDKSKTVFVYCKIGGRSADAVKILAKNKFNNIIRSEERRVGKECVP